MFPRRGHDPTETPSQGGLSEEEYRHYQELHRKSMAGDSPDQMATLEAWQGSRTWSWATIGLTALILILYGAVFLEAGSINAVGQHLLEYGSLSPALVGDGEWFRLVTCMFLHYQPIDLLFNVWFLFAAGRVVERTLGRAAVLGIFLASGLAGSLYIYQRGLGEPIASSPAVFGVIGAMIGIYLRYRGAIPQPLRSTYLGFVPLIVIYAIVATVQPGIFNLESTAAGLAAGIIIPIVLPRMGIYRADKGTGSRTVGRLVMATCLAVVAVSYVQLFGDALGLSAPEPGKRFEHPDAGWAMLLPAGYEAEVAGQEAVFTHPARETIYGVGYDRSLLLKSAEEAKEEFRRLFGLYAGGKEKLKEVVTLAGQPFVLFRVESKDGAVITQYMAGEEILRRHAIYFFASAQADQLERAHETLLMMVESFEYE